MGKEEGRSIMGKTHVVHAGPEPLRRERENQRGQRYQRSPVINQHGVR